MKRSELYDWIRFQVQAGVSPPKRIFDGIGYQVSDVEDPSPNFAQKARGLAAKLLKERDAEERTWTDRSRNDDLDDAFEALNAAGIVALQDPGWTQSMSWEAAHEERERQEQQGRRVRGAVFYHTQDLEHAVEGQGLYLAFGAFTAQQDDDASAGIAREVRDVLAAHGVPTQWDGSAGARVLIPPFPWRKRRSSQGAPADLTARKRTLDSDLRRANPSRATLSGERPPMRASPSPDDLRADVRAYYDEVVQAFAAGDAGALVQLFDAAIERPMTRDQIRAWGEGFFGEHGSARFVVERVEIESLRAEEAVVRLTYRVETTDGRGSFGGIERDVLARRGSRWAMTAWEVVEAPERAGP